MSEISVPTKMWKSFLKIFGERHAGWLVQVETHDTGTDETVDSQISALHSIELDDEDQPNPRIKVVVLYDSKELKRILFRPSRVVLEISGRDGHDSLRITSLNTDTTIRMRGAKKLDLLDVIKTLNVLDVVRDEAA